MSNEFLRSVKSPHLIIRTLEDVFINNKPSTESIIEANEGGIK